MCVHFFYSVQGYNSHIFKNSDTWAYQPKLSIPPLNVKAAAVGNLAMAAQTPLIGTDPDSWLSYGDKHYISIGFAGFAWGSHPQWQDQGFPWLSPPTSRRLQYRKNWSPWRKDWSLEGSTACCQLQWVQVGESTTAQLQGPVTSALFCTAQIGSSVQASPNSQPQHIRKDISKTSRPWKISGKREEQGPLICNSWWCCAHF